MKRAIGLVLLLALFSIPLLAGKNSHEFLLSSDVRVGDTQLQKGYCSVTWREASGSEVKLTITTEKNKTITVPARVSEWKASRYGVSTVDVNGVTYLAELYTPNAKFIIVRDGSNDLK